MVFVVETDAENLSRRDGRKQLGGGIHNVGHGQFAVEIALEAANAAVGLLRAEAHGLSGIEIAEDLHEWKRSR